MPRWWCAICWTIFVVGALGTLWSLAVLGRLCPDTHHAKGLLLGTLFVSFSLAAVNTFVAANGFTARLDDLTDWLKRCLEHVSSDPTPQDAKELGSSFGLYETDGMPHGHLFLELRSEAVSAWVVRATGAYRPEPFRSDAPKHGGNWSYGDYIALLRAETHAARVRAGQIAAALGGLFVTAIQVYVRLP
ncbi:MAG: hypothetical protein L6Q95_19170 [Planctomycetes bacterium]|nr:hypothetical protein [Planctomycetota bacterium]